MKRSNVTLILIFSSVQQFSVILTVQYTILLLNTYLSKYAHTWHWQKEKGKINTQRARRPPAGYHGVVFFFSQPRSANADPACTFHIPFED
jgi:hypothetical protein